MSLALSLCQYVLRPRRGLGQASLSLEAPRLQALETGPRYKGLVLGSFLAPETDMIFGDGVGASLVLQRFDHWQTLGEMIGNVASFSSMSNLQNFFRQKLSQPAHFDVNVS